MITISSILCPVDVSEASRHSLALVAALARWYASAVTVLHVYRIPMPAAPVSGYPGEILPLPPIQPDGLREEIERFSQPLRVAGLTPTIVVEVGDPAEVIVRMATETAVDLVIVGTHGRSGLRRLLLGSVAERVLRNAPCPVLTVPPMAEPEGSPSFKTIVCPIDFGPSSLRALEHALSLAKESDASLILLHVVDSVASSVTAAETVGFAIPDHQQSIEREAAERLAALIPANASDWCHAEPVVTSGKVAPEILRVAADRRADLIVMGVQGRSAASLLVFGSTVHEVCRDATAPVLTVRAPTGTA